MGDTVSESATLPASALPLDKIHDACDLLTAKPPVATWLVDSLMPAGYVLMLYSPEGVGKTVLAYNLALSVATNTPFLGRPTSSGTVLYLDEENPDIYLHDLLSKMCRSRGIRPDDLRGRLLFGRFALLGKRAEDWSALVERTVEVIRPSLIVLDTFSSILPFIENVENDNALMRGMFRYIRAMKARSPETTILVLHHPAKGQTRPRGAGAIGQDVDGYYSLNFIRGRYARANHITVLNPEKARCLAGVHPVKIKPLVTAPDCFDLTGSIVGPDDL